MAAFHISSQSPKCGFFVLSLRASDRSHSAVRCALRLYLKPLFWEARRKIAAPKDGKTAKNPVGSQFHFVIGRVEQSSNVRRSPFQVH
jgi:hypothetical protein